MGEHPEGIRSASRVVEGNYKCGSRSYGPRCASELEVRCEHPHVLGSARQSTEPSSHYSYQEFQGKHQTIPKYPILYFFPGPHICQKKKNLLTSPSLKSSPTRVTSLIWSPVLAVKLYCLKSLGFKNNLFFCAHICPRCPFIEFTEYKWKKVITRQSV